MSDERVERLLNKAEAAIDRGGWALTFTGAGFIIVGAVIIWWIIDLFLIPGMTRRANGFK